MSVARHPRPPELEEVTSVPSIALSEPAGPASIATPMRSRHEPIR
jgi:hypothetical protein